MKNYYEILEVSSKASQEIIEKSYRVLAKKYHPDVQNGVNRYLAEETLKDINEAYSVLSDSHLRQAYDREYNKIYGTKNMEDNLKTYNEANETHGKKNNKQKNNKENDNGWGMVQLVKNIIKSIKNLSNKEYRQQHAGELSQKIIAIILTIVIMAAIIFTLWNIPLTRSWITGV